MLWAMIRHGRHVHFSFGPYLGLLEKVPFEFSGEQVLSQNLPHVSDIDDETS